MKIQWQDSRFIETERVPSDARVVDHTWKHPNKSGGPDRRFKDNRQIPICLYEAMHLTSSSGVNELVEFSKIGVVGAFVDGCRMLAALPRGRLVPPLPSAANDSAELVLAADLARKRGSLKVALLTITGLLIGIPVLAAVLRFGTDSLGTTPPTIAVAEAPASMPVKTADLVHSPEAKLVSPPQSTIIVSSPVSTVVAVDADRPAQAEKREPEKVVRYTQTSVNLREGPGTRFGVIEIVPKGAAVSVSEVKGAWARVETEDKKSGWMANSTISEHTESP